MEAVTQNGSVLVIKIWHVGDSPATVIALKSILMKYDVKLANLAGNDAEMKGQCVQWGKIF